MGRLRQGPLFVRHTRVSGSTVYTPIWCLVPHLHHLHMVPAKTGACQLIIPKKWTRFKMFWMPGHVPIPHLKGFTARNWRPLRPKRPVPWPRFEKTWHPCQCARLIKSLPAHALCLEFLAKELVGLGQDVTSYPL